MANKPTPKQFLRLALAGCNAAEIAAWLGTSEAAAQALLCKALRDYASAKKPERLSRAA